MLVFCDSWVVHWSARLCEVAGHLSPRRQDKEYVALVQALKANAYKFCFLGSRDRTTLLPPLPHCRPSVAVIVSPLGRKHSFRKFLSFQMSWMIIGDNF